jgi:uncharacterized membrane protein
MFTDSPIFVRFRSSRQQWSGRSSGLVLAPGLVLTLMAIAILVWPELLAYLVASVMLMGGLALLLWGWTIRQAERRLRSQSAIRYEVH